MMTTPLALRPLSRDKCCVAWYVRRATQRSMDIRGAERRVADLMFLEPYQGDLYDERFHGFGRTMLLGGEEYVGQFCHGRRHGHGTAVWPDGLKYVGTWQENTATGVGSLSWPGGAIFVGEIRQHQVHR
jgi:hypothetical protein